MSSDIINGILALNEIAQEANKSEQFGALKSTIKITTVDKDSIITTIKTEFFDELNEKQKDYALRAFKSGAPIVVLYLRNKQRGA